MRVGHRHFTPNPVSLLPSGRHPASSTQGTPVSLANITELDHNFTETVSGLSAASQNVRDYRARKSRQPHATATGDDQVEGEPAHQPVEPAHLQKSVLAHTSLENGSLNAFVSSSISLASARHAYHEAVAEHEELQASHQALSLEDLLTQESLRKD